LSLSHKAVDLFCPSEWLSARLDKKTHETYSVIRHSILLMYNAHFNHNF